MGNLITAADTPGIYASISGTNLLLPSYTDQNNRFVGIYAPTGFNSITLKFAAMSGDAITLKNYAYSATVPEPSTYGMALGGLALGLVAIRRRKRAQNK